MRVTTGIVVDGKVVVAGESLTEGSSVTVVLRDDEEAFDLTPEEENELIDSIARIARGEFASGDQLLERLRRLTSSRKARVSPRALTGSSRQRNGGGEIVPTSEWEWDRSAVLDEVEALRKRLGAKRRFIIAELLTEGRL
jgi:hypothetical protein